MTYKSQQGPKYNSTISIQIELNNIYPNISQQYLSKFSKINKNSQFQLKPLYNIMQATRLLQLNNPPQHIYQHHNIECLRMLTSIEKKKVINKYNLTISIQKFKK